MAFKTVGKSFGHIEGSEKVSGRAVYTADLRLPQMLWGKTHMKKTGLLGTAGLFLENAGNSRLPRWPHPNHRPKLLDRPGDEYHAK